VRQIFGAQNVEWRTLRGFGGLELSNMVLPYNRIVIIAFSMLVL